MEIPFKNITEVVNDSSLNFTKNSIIVKTKGGKSTKLVVSQKKK
jgi:hypothetical protein